LKIDRLGTLTMTVQQDREQLFLELINRDRMDPAAAAARYGLADLSTGTTTIITTAAKQVLAFNTNLFNSATIHNQYLIANDLFTHTGSGGSTSAQRMVTAGYGTSGSFGSGENLAWTGSTGTYNANAEVLQQHQNLFLSAGHRSNMLNANYEEIGISAITDASYQGYNALVTAQNFGYKLATPVFVTGVSYTDSDNNDFYSIGESNAGRNVSLYSGAALLSSTTTSASGGYQIQTPASGSVEIVFSGSGIVGEQAASFTLGSINAKVDLTDSNTIESNISTNLTRGANNLTLLGMENISGTGNALNNIILGNKGNNTLSGGDGADTLNGGDGNDTLNGGNGNDALMGGLGSDTAQFSLNMSSYVVTYLAATQTYTLYGNDGAVDTLTGVENFNFADGTRTAAQLNIATSAPLRTATVSAVTPSLNEGNSASTTFTFNVSLNAAAYQTLTVAWSAAGTGLQAADASDFSGSVSGNITFAVGETSKTLFINVVGDTVYESNETFQVSLTSPSAGLLIGTASAVATILNDDIPAVNLVNGTAAIDYLYGTSGKDQQNGFAGNDFLYASTSADKMDGGADSDFAYYYYGTQGVTVNLSSGLGTGGEAEGDTYIAIENVAATNAADVLVGDSAANTIWGFDGNDVVYGNAGADTISGGGGDDTIITGSGADVVDGGSGIDFIYYYYGTEGVTVNLSSGTGSGGEAEGDTYSSIENIAGTNSVDVLVGDASNNTIWGFDGNDVMYGNAGADYLSGGAGDDFLLSGYGADTIDGGSGVDFLYYYDGTEGVTVNLASGKGSGGEAEGDIFSSIENVAGTNFADVLVGDASNNTIWSFDGDDIVYGNAGDDYLSSGAGNDTIISGAGIDTLDGGDGIDTAYYYYGTESVNVNLGSGVGSGGEAAGDIYYGIENVAGTNAGDILIGNEGANTLWGFDGIDRITGAGGNDVMAGGDGADRFVFNAASFGADTITDYVDGLDKLEISSFLAHDMSEISVTQLSSNSVLLSFASGNVQLNSSFGISVGSDDFVFI
jgi:Ca2+-binding RTX toxin-like protein